MFRKQDLVVVEKDKRGMRMARSLVEERAREGQDALLEPPIAVQRSKLGYRFVKRIFDIVCSGLALLVLSPLLLVIAVLIKLEDGGPIIHARLCVGAKKEYRMYKFRSMVPDADNLQKYFTEEQLKQYLKEVKLDHDPRVTRIGKILRKTSLDELPQLLDVFKGDMSLVGPRPLVEEELCYYGGQARRFLFAKPGITGYWQVNGRSDSTYESGKRQLLELYYVDHSSVWLDIKILFQTVMVVLKGVGAK